MNMSSFSTKMCRQAPTSRPPAHMLTSHCKPHRHDALQVVGDLEAPLPIKWWARRARRPRSDRAVVLVSTAGRLTGLEISDLFTRAPLHSMSILGCTPPPAHGPRCRRINGTSMQPCTACGRRPRCAIRTLWWQPHAHNTEKRSCRVSAAPASAQ